MWTLDDSFIPLAPQTFWEKYRDAFRNCLWKQYRNLPDRTTKSKEAAESVMTQDGLRVTREWCRVDLIGWHYPNEQDEDYNWILDVVFDHENARNWRYELGSHVHLAADLCVIVAYWDYREGGLSDLKAYVQQSISRLAAQILRVPNRSWLFIFGPDTSHPQEPFVAFTFDPDGPQLAVRQLNDQNPLRPCDWPDYP